MPCLCGHFCITFKAALKNVDGAWEPMTEADARKNHLGPSPFLPSETWLTRGNNVPIIIKGSQERKTPRGQEELSEIVYGMSGSCGITWREFSCHNGEELGADCMAMNYKLSPAAPKYPERGKGAPCPHAWESHFTSVYIGQKGHVMTGNINPVLPGNTHRFWFPAAC